MRGKKSSSNLKTFAPAARGRDGQKRYRSAIDTFRPGRPWAGYCNRETSHFRHLGLREFAAGWPGGRAADGRGFSCRLGLRPRRNMVESRALEVQT